MRGFSRIPSALILFTRQRGIVPDFPTDINFPSAIKPQPHKLLLGRPHFLHAPDQKRPILLL